MSLGELALMAIQESSNKNFSLIATVVGGSLRTDTPML